MEYTDSLFLTNFRWRGHILWVECADQYGRGYPVLYLSMNLKTPCTQWACYAVSDNPIRLLGPDYGLDHDVISWINRNYTAIVAHWRSEISSTEFLEKIKT